MAARPTNDAAVLAAVAKHGDFELPALVLDALGLSVEAAERRAGKKRPSCWYGDPKARTSNAGLGVTVDERYQTSIDIALWARGANDLLNRALRIDESPTARKHNSYWDWESSVVDPLAAMSIGLVEMTNGRRSLRIAGAWRSAWKAILVTPTEPPSDYGEPDGGALAGALLGFFGRLVPQKEYDLAGKQMLRLRMKSPDAHLVMFRIVDLTVRDVLPEILEQAELPELAKELRAIAPIRTMDDVAATRVFVDRAIGETQLVADRARALCTVVDPMLGELDTGPAEVARYLQALDAAYELGVPNLDDVTRAFFVQLAKP